MKKKLLLIVKLIPLAAFLNIMFWIMVNRQYREFMMYWAGDNLVLHLQDIVSTLLECSILTALVCMFSGYLVNSFAPHPHNLTFTILRKLLLLAINLCISFIYTHVLVVTDAGIETFTPAFFVYAMSSTLVSDIYATYTAQKALDEEKRMRKTEQFARMTTQVDNHFMFNSLISLKSLITAETVQQAQDYLGSLLKCYKYIVLKNHEKLSSISDEMSFLESYIVMISKPYPDVTIDIDPGIASVKGQIPALCIQQSVENAIKHNARTGDNPLHISIFSGSPDSITVQNNIVPLQSQYPTLGTSINRLREFYEMFGKKVRVYNDGTTYKIILPIITVTKEGYTD